MLPTTYQVFFSSNPLKPNDFGDNTKLQQTQDDIFTGLDWHIANGSAVVGTVVTAQGVNENYRLFAWTITHIGHNPEEDIPVYYLNYTPELNLKNFSGDACVNLVFDSYTSGHDTAQVGVAYSADVIFSQGEPINLSSLVLPDGITATVNGLRVELRGTPTTAENFALSFVATGCNSETVDIAFDLVVADACVAVRFDSHSNDSFGQAETGAPYDNTLTFTGTAPISLDSFNLPDGLSASVSGMTVVISGEVENNNNGDPFNAQVVVTNCSGGGTETVDWEMVIA